MIKKLCITLKQKEIKRSWQEGHCVLENNSSCKKNGYSRLTIRQKISLGESQQDEDDKNYNNTGRKPEKIKWIWETFKRVNRL